MCKEYKWAINEKKKQEKERKKERNTSINKFKKIINFTTNQRNTN